MPSWSEVARAVRVQCFSSEGSEGSFCSDWLQVTQWGLQQMPMDASEATALRPIVDSLMQGIETKTDSLLRIVEFVRDEIRYVAVEIGEGRFQPRAPGEILANRYGDCKDKVALARTMLSVIGIQSWPTLASAGGSVNASLPTPFQFNHCILTLPADTLLKLPVESRAAHQGWIYFDPTSVTYSVGNIPTSLMGSYVLPLKPEVTEPVLLRELRPEDRWRETTVDATLTETGKVTGHVIISCRGMTAEELSFEWSGLEGVAIADEWKDLLDDVLQNVTVANISVSPGHDTAELSFDFEADGGFTNAGDLSLVKLDLLSSARSPLKSKSSRRFPIDFGDARKYSARINWQLPEGWTIVEPVSSAETACDIAAVSSEANARDDGFEFMYSITYQGGQLAPEHITDAQAVIEAVQNIANAYLILKGS